MSRLFIDLMLLEMILGQRLMLVAMQWLVYPLIAALFGVSLFLIPYWEQSFGTDTTQSVGEMAKSILLVIPVLIFAFNFSSVISHYNFVMLGRIRIQPDAGNSVVHCPS